MAAVGSAVGLGNIWRFPYTCGKYGGGAFLIVYICFVFLIGSVLMMSEFVIGRRAQHTPIKAFPALRPDRKGWGLVGLLGIVTSFFILSQYLVLSGWTTGYIWESLSGSLAALGTGAAPISNYFSQFSTGTKPILFLVIFALLGLFIVLGGVQKGIENVSKVLMPVLVVLILVLCVRSLTLPGAVKGVEYLFSPDFSKLTGEGILAALGQALFSLSVGMGIMLVYGSYIPVNDNIFKTAMWITVCDTLIAVLAGLAIFPAVFSCGLDPAGGPIRPGRWSRTGVLCAAQCVQYNGWRWTGVFHDILHPFDGCCAHQRHLLAGGTHGHTLRAYRHTPGYWCRNSIPADHAAGSGVLALGRPSVSHQAGRLHPV